MAPRDPTSWRAARHAHTSPPTAPPPPHGEDPGRPTPPALAVTGTAVGSEQSSGKATELPPTAEPVGAASGGGSSRRPRHVQKEAAHVGTGARDPRPPPGLSPQSSSRPRRGTPGLPLRVSAAPHKAKGTPGKERPPGWPELVHSCGLRPDKDNLRGGKLWGLGVPGSQSSGGRLHGSGPEVRRRHGGSVWRRKAAQDRPPGRRVLTRDRTQTPGTPSSHTRHHPVRPPGMGALVRSRLRGRLATLHLLATPHAWALGSPRVRTQQG